MMRQPIPPDGRKKQDPTAPGDGSAHTWDTALDAVSDWVCIIDTRCIIRRTNPAVESVLNIPPERVAGMHCHTLMHRTCTPHPDCPLPRMLASGRREGAEFKLEDGRWFKITLDPLRNKNGEICGAVHMARDITREVLIRRENAILLRDLKRAIGRIKALNGLIPICSACKNIRDAEGLWIPIETYVEANSNASFSHGICPDCMDRIYGKEPWYQVNKEGRGK